MTIFLLIGLLTGCYASFPNANTLIEEHYSGTDFNDVIELVRIKSILEKDTKKSGIEVVIIGDDVYFDLVNQSNKLIRFPPDGGAEYFFYDREAHEWVNIEDNRTNMNEDPQMLLPNDATEYITGFYSIDPAIPWTLNSTRLIPFRVVVTGIVVNENGDELEEVGAFFNLFFKPPSFD